MLKKLSEDYYRSTSHMFYLAGVNNGEIRSATKVKKNCLPQKEFDRWNIFLETILVILPARLSLC